MADNDQDVNNEASEQNTGADVPSTNESKNSEVDSSSLMDAMKEDPELNSTKSEESESGESEDQQPVEYSEEEADKSEDTDQSEGEDADSENEAEPRRGRTQGRIRGLSAENRALKDRIAELEGQRNIPHTAEEYVEAGYSEAQAEMAALKEQMQIDKENSRVAQLNANMHEDGVNAEHDFGIYNEKSPDYDKDFADAVAADYRRYANLQTDPSGQYVLRADIPLYDFYKSAAERYERGLSRGRTAGAADSAKQYASAEQAPSSRPAPKTTEQSDVDKLLAGMKSRLPS